jgi:putative transposase
MPSDIAATEATRGGERQAQANRRGPGAPQGDAAGRHQAKAMRLAQRREVVDPLGTTWQVSVRRACLVLRAERSSYHYKGKRRPQAVLRKRIQEIAETRVRYGYRRIHVLLGREGCRVNAKRVWRLYREMGLQLRNQTPKRRAKAKLREGRSAAMGANEVWAIDFVHDRLFDGRKIRGLTIIDTFTRLSLAIDVRQSYRGADVVATLERAAAEVGLPKSTRR